MSTNYGYSVGLKYISPSAVSSNAVIFLFLNLYIEFKWIIR